jgi:hypothetical protein
MQVKENLEAGQSDKAATEHAKLAGSPAKEPATGDAPRDKASSAPRAGAQPERGFVAVSRSEIGADRWNAFAEKSPSAWLWHRYDLSEIWGEWNKREDKSFALISRSNSEIVATVPTFLDGGRIAKWFPWNSLHVLGGPAIDPQVPRKMRTEVCETIAQHLETMARANQVQEVKYSLAPMTPNIRGEACPRINPLWEFGCANAVGQTWVCDLRKSKDDLWRGIGKGAKSSISKAQKLGVQVRQANGSADLDAYYRLHCETYSRTGKGADPRVHFEMIWKNFVDRKLAVVFLAEHEGAVVGAAKLAVYKKGAWYWTGGSNAAGLNAGANALIQWHAIQWMVDNGVEWYEVGEAHLGLKNNKLKQISDFKKDFGGELYPLFKGTIDTKTRLGRTLALLKDFRG